MKTRTSPGRSWAAQPRTGLSLLLILALAVGSLTACDAANDAGSNTATAGEVMTSDPPVPTLTGVWEAANPKGADTTQRAFISDSTITIYWVQGSTEDRALYWTGSFKAPTSPGPYTWTSNNDHEQTNTALLASTDDTKDFTYKDDHITYKATAAGVTKTITLKQTSTTIPSGADTTNQPVKPEGEAKVVESGIAVDGNYGWVTAMVEYEGLTGEFATVLFNVFDGDGNLIASQEQIEQLGTKGAKFPIGTQVEIPPGTTAASVKASVSVSDYGSSAEPMPVIEPVTSSTPDPKFQISNSTGQDWKNPRITIVCRDDSGQIAGGGGAFPTMIPAGAQYLVSNAYLILSDDATECTAYTQLTPDL